MKTSTPPEAKILRIAGEQTQSELRKTIGRGTFVLMKGVFDLLHAGHLRALLEGSKHADALVVAVTTDEIVSKKKGPTRPIIPYEDRKFQISCLSVVDAVIPNPFTDLAELLTLVKPDFFVASHFGNLNESDFRATEFIRVPRVGDYDTSGIVARIRGESNQ